MATSTHQEMNRTDLNRLILLLRSLTTSINDVKDAICAENNSADSPEEPPALPIIQPVVSLPPAVVAYYEAEQRERPIKEKRERTKRIVEYSGVALLAIYTVFTAFMYCANKKAADAAKEAAQAASAQVSLMRQQLETQEALVEPSVYVTTTNEEGELPWPNGVNVSFINIGDTAASEVHMELTVSGRVPLKREIERILLEKTPVNVFRIEPTYINPNIADRRPQIQTYPFTVSGRDKKLFSTGKWSVVSEGTLSYLTAFKKPVKRDFCFVFWERWRKDVKGNPLRDGGSQLPCDHFAANWAAVSGTSADQKTNDKK